MKFLMVALFALSSAAHGRALSDIEDKDFLKMLNDRLTCRNAYVGAAKTNGFISHFEDSGPMNASSFNGSGPALFVSYLVWHNGDQSILVAPPTKDSKSANAFYRFQRPASVPDAQYVCFTDEKNHAISRAFLYRKSQIEFDQDQYAPKFCGKEAKKANAFQRLPAAQVFKAATLSGDEAKSTRGDLLKALEDETAAAIRSLNYDSLKSQAKTSSGAGFRSPAFIEDPSSVEAACSRISSTLGSSSRSLDDVAKKATERGQLEASIDKQNRDARNNCAIQGKPAASCYHEQLYPADALAPDAKSTGAVDRAKSNQRVR